jgi:hypothetical protein
MDRAVCKDPNSTSAGPAGINGQYNGQYTADSSLTITTDVLSKFGRGRILSRTTLSVFVVSRLNMAPYAVERTCRSAPAPPDSQNAVRRTPDAREGPAPTPVCLAT